MRLLTRMLLLILVPTFICMALMTFISEHYAENALARQTESQLTQVAEVQAREINNILTMLFGMAQQFSSDHAMFEFLGADKATQPEAWQVGSEQVTDGLKDFVNAYNLITSAGVVDTKGIVQAHSMESSMGTDYSDRNYFKTVLSTKKPTFEVVTSRATKALAIILAAPVYDEKSKKMFGVAFFSVDLSVLSAQTTNNITLAKTGYIFVIDSTGKTIMHPKKETVGHEMGQYDWGKSILAKKEAKGFIDYTWQGVPKKAGFAKVPLGNFTVLFGIENSDFMAPVNELIQIAMAVAGISIFVVACIVFLVARSVTHPLQDGVKVIEYIGAGNLEFTPEQQKGFAIVAARPDEFGAFARGIGKMREGLANLFDDAKQKSEAAEKATAEAHKAAQAAEEATKRAVAARSEGMLAAAESLDGVVNVLTSASSQLASQIAESERGAAVQAARITETATAMEEMNSTVLEVARNAGDASSLSASTRTKAEAGAEVVEKAVQTIHVVQDQSNKLKTSMTELDSSAKAVSQIMSVISDIADQTNLLALNAAIEAARAGEAGRGFAVVADEVRKLAEKTMASTTDVDKAIRAIQASASHSSNLVEQSVNAIEEATTYANQSGEALKEIVAMVDSSADQVRAIAAASEQQSATSEEINRSIGDVNTIAVETSNAMREAGQAVEELARQAQVLANTVADMKKG